MAGERTSTVDPILLAASELFERQGFEGTSVAEIAARAGFARSTVFARYRSKEALLVSIVRAFHEALGRLPDGPPAIPRPAEVPPGAPDAEEVVRHFREACQRLGALARVAVAARELPWIRRAVGDGHDASRGLLRRWFGDPGLDDADLDLLWDVLRRACIDSDRQEPADAAAVVRLVLRFRSSGAAAPCRRAGRVPVRARG
ncbi:MAG: helix-turn-helix transcriptional regulator [Myxococcales bacterium]|nr:helix-turn-helix transcriptional regulator [Myxococcales bacterium]